MVMVMGHFAKSKWRIIAAALAKGLGHTKPAPRSS